MDANFVGLKEVLSTLTQITEQEWREFEQLFTLRRMAKSEYFARTGEQASHIGFVVSGTFRAFYLSLIVCVEMQNDDYLGVFVKTIAIQGV